MPPSNFQYTILAGDTLAKITHEINACIGVTLPNVMDANPHLDVNNINVGQVVEIPAIITTRKGLSYTMRSGDTLDQILVEINARSGITCEQIEQANPSVDSMDLQVGQLIVIPEITAEPIPPVIPHPIPIVGSEHKGYWHWTYHHSEAPEETTMGIAFFGSIDPDEALEQSEAIRTSLKGEKYICLGGGTSAGRYTVIAIKNIIDALDRDLFKDYDGIAFDVEVGVSGLEKDFQILFEKTKEKNLKVLVTVSHSRPYGIHDGTALMRSFLANKNIDFISPQLYTNGMEPANQYTAYGVRWEEYGLAKAVIIPSIVKASYYEAAHSYFANRGVKLSGYIQWHQH